MTSEGLWEMSEGDRQTCAPEISASVDGGRAEGLACADPGARTPISASGNLLKHLAFLYLLHLALYLAGWG